MTITLTREEAQELLNALTYVGDAKVIYSDTIETLRARLAQPEPEPTFICLTCKADRFKEDCKSSNRVNCGLKIEALGVQTTAPSQREFIGLTDEEIRNEANHHVFDESFFNGAIWARGQIMGKNNG